jgi:hypothetical protein
MYRSHGGPSSVWFACLPDRLAKIFSLVAFVGYTAYGRPRLRSSPAQRETSTNPRMDDTLRETRRNDAMTT